MAAATLLSACRRPEPVLSPVDEQWRSLLPDYERSARDNIVTVDGRRAMLASRLYPCTYIRDALFWGPLALDDDALGFECYRWFADSLLPSGQARSAVALRPADEHLCIPTDDEGTLLFVIASDWLAGRGHPVDARQVESAYRFVQTHVRDDLYLSAPGPFRYWADTVNPEVELRTAFAELRQGTFIKHTTL